MIHIHPTLKYMIAIHSNIRITTSYTIEFLKKSSNYEKSNFTYFSPSAMKNLISHTLKNLLQHS